MKKGFATGFVLVILLVLSVLGYALVSRGIAGLSQTLHTQQVTQAYYAGQSGVALAIYAVKANDPNLPALCGQTLSPTSLLGINTLQLLTDSAKFSLKITNNYGTLCLSNQLAADGTSVPPGMIYVSSTGQSFSTRKTCNVLLSVAKGWPFQYAAFGDSTLQGNISFSGSSTVDSFNSNNGPYGALNSNLGNGNVGTNANGTGAVTLSGNATIKGNVSVGAGGTAGSPTISASGGATYNSASALSSALTLPANVDPNGGYGTTNVSSGVLTPGKYGSISLTGGSTLTLSCGTYSVGSISVTGSAQLIVSSTCTTVNPVKIYVYNSLSLAGGGVMNATDNSTALLIYGMPSLTAVSITGNGSSAYALYAPNAAITLSSGDVYGSLIGKSVSISGGGNLHYDQALNNDSTAGITEVLIKSWNSL